MSNAVCQARRLESAREPSAAAAGIVESEGVGVVVRDEDDRSLRRAARDLVDMGADPVVRARCREVARLHFDIDGGVAQYVELYRELKARSATSLPA